MRKNLLWSWTERNFCTGWPGSTIEKVCFGSLQHKVDISFHSEKKFENGLVC